MSFSDALIQSRKSSQNNQEDESTRLDPIIVTAPSGNSQDVSVDDQGPADAGAKNSETNSPTIQGSGPGDNTPGAPDTAGRRGRQPNKLNQFASYSTIVTLSPISNAGLADPTIYRNSGPSNIILRSGGTGNEQVKTSYESDLGITTEYFIDDIEIQSIIAPGPMVRQTNATLINFKVYEPYSMGIFLETLQNSVTKAGRDAPVNYTTQPFLLTIQFVGFSSEGERVETGETRYIPLRFSNIEFEVTAGGSVYNCSAYAYNEYALSSEVQNLPEDVKVNGSTVAEILQTSDKSLTTLLNQKQLELKESGNKKSADVYIISFPPPTPSGGGSSGGDQGATTMSSVSDSVNAGGDDGFNVSDLKASADNASGANAIGQAKIRNKDSDAGDRDTFPQDQSGEALKENPSKPDDNKLNFKKNDRIQDIIEHIVKHSEYGRRMAEQKADSKGYIDYWRIEPEVYEVVNPENVKQRGAYAKVFNYKVLEYKVHSSHFSGQRKVPPGIDILRKQIPKEYEYIYTGKNDDIIDFNIRFNSAFIHGALNDSYQANWDQNSSSQKAGDTEETAEPGVAEGGSDSDESEPDAPTVDAPDDESSTGSGDLDIDPKDRITQQFNEIITNGVDLITAEMDIMGDPYYIADSGLGNYTAGRAGNQTTTDGSIDYQFEETCCILNFRTPLDISAETGEYIFSSDGTQPVRKFSGVYRITQVTNNISGNKFTQKLEMQRMRNQNGEESSNFGVAKLDKDQELEEILEPVSFSINQFRNV